MRYCVRSNVRYMSGHHWRGTIPTKAVTDCKTWLVRQIMFNAQICEVRHLGRKERKGNKVTEGHRSTGCAGTWEQSIPLYLYQRVAGHVE